jgi:hypothetical protein
MINFYNYFNKHSLDKFDDYNEALYEVSYLFLCRPKYDFTPILHIIRKNPRIAYQYTCLVIKDRWLEAEPYIMKDSEVAYLYASRVMKERWFEAESYIKVDAHIFKWYKHHFDIVVDS